MPTIRSLLRAPHFTALAVLTLALGIGAATAMFSLLDAVVLRPLPYPAAERLVTIEHAVPGVKAGSSWGISKSNFFYYARARRSIEAIAVYAGDAVGVSGEGGAEQVPMVATSASMFSVLGIRPVLGRLYTAADNALPNDTTAGVVISDAFWRRRFGASAAAVGQNIHIGSTALPVLGVLPAGADMPERHVDLWMPLSLDSLAPAQNEHTYHALARLRPGVDAAVATAELGSLARALPSLFPTAYTPAFMRETGFSPVITPLRDNIVGQTLMRALWVLLGAVGLVLLVATANVANLFLVRLETRRREFAVRTALGATRGDLTRQLLAESAVLTIVAALTGLLLASWILSLVVRLAPADFPRVGEVGLAWTSVAFAIAIALLIALSISVVPALRRGFVQLAAIRDGGRGLTASRARMSARSVLIVGQVALALVLLSAAGLMLRTTQQLRAVRSGITPDGVATFSVALPWSGYRGYDRVEAFYRALLSRAAMLPGVVAAGAGQWLPFGGGEWCSTVFTEDDPAVAGQSACVHTALVAPGYFASLGIPVRGRDATWDEVENGQGGVVVSAALARRLWPGEDAIGKGIKGNGSRPPFYRVVGVTNDLRGEGLDKPATEIVFFPMMPMQGAPLWSPPRAMTVIVRARGDGALALTPALRRLVAEMDPEVPTANFRSMNEIVASSMARVSFSTVLLLVAAALALALSAVGLYGVVSYVVGQRTAEIGVRLALGARGGQVWRMVMTQSTALAVAGIGVGLVATVIVSRVLRSLLYGVEPSDPLTLAGAALVLLLFALLAAHVPARRAALVDPMVAMRGD